MCLRVFKTGARTTDQMWIQFYSYYTQVMASDEESLGQSAYVRCNSEHVNFPKIFSGLLHFV